MNSRRLSLVLALSLTTAPCAYAASAVMLQFGSFETMAEAKQRLSQVKTAHPTLLNGIDTSVREVKLPPDNLTVYRTQAGPVASRSAGQSLCSQFTASGEECYVVETAVSAETAKAKPVEEKPAEQTTATTSTAKPYTPDPAPLKEKESVATPIHATSKDSSSDIETAMNKAVEAQNSAPAPHSISAPGEPPKPSLWSRLNPFDDSGKTAAPAAAAATETTKIEEQVTKTEDVQPAAEEKKPETAQGEEKKPEEPKLVGEPALAMEAASPKLASLMPPPEPVATATPIAPVMPAPQISPTSPKLASLAVPVEPAPAIPEKPLPMLAAMPASPAEANAAPAPFTQSPLIPAELLPPPPILNGKDRDFMRRTTTAPVAPAAPVAPTVLKQPSVLATPSVLASPTALAKQQPLAEPIRPQPTVVAPTAVTATAPIPLPPMPTPGDGLVQVEEAKRVPLTQSNMIPAAPLHQLNPAVPTISLLPSSTVGVKTFWAQIGPFNDPQMGLAFWENYRIAHPDFPVVRVRVVSGVQQQAEGNTRVSLRVGPFGRSGFVTNLCESIEDEDKIRCGLIKDSGVAGSAGSTVPGALNGSRYKR